MFFLLSSRDAGQSGLRGVGGGLLLADGPSQVRFQAEAECLACCRYYVLA